MKSSVAFWLAAWSAACAVVAAPARTQAATIVSATHAGTSVVDSPVITPGGMNPGALLMEGRAHILAVANYNATSGSLTTSPPNGSDIASLPFPSYLAGNDYVRVNVSNRNIADYQMTVTTAVPSIVYLLLDNRLGDNLGGSSNNLADPELQRPEHAWVAANGWTRVNTGLTPNGAGDYTGADEGGNGSLDQFYAIYRNVTGPNNQIVLGAQFEGRNMYLVSARAIPEPASLLLAGTTLAALLTRRRVVA